ncbi:2'-5' RNA ligase family protein [Cognatiyoonia sp. IB215182]|uniref:2'-5' RNA ligase family protein n=1 Tax=Cognatiyoonia sp. IB215182 TaxID=3097353 RepID=UPI002A103B27|nr:2'-5' RNA ligase family protein [Cognatiyoonia sp. IB215182]MDX8352438.1 2'-5' RNA ligase family protein [Cognatiyoonia sp. IB215182]
MTEGQPVANIQNSESSGQVADFAVVEFSNPPSHYPSMIYVLAYPEFDPLCDKRIHDFRAKQEPHRAKLVPPHLTLVFGVKSEHLSVITELAEAVSRETQAFRITFGDHAIELDPFEQKHKIFLLCGKGGCKVTALHNRLYNGEHHDEFSEKYSFRPHMTVATCDTSAQIERINVSDVGPLPLHATLRALEIVQLSNGALSTLIRLPFRQ